MTKITLNNVANLIDTTTAQTTINNNSAVIQTAMDNTLSRDGTAPNTMNAVLDMNNNRIFNLPAPVTAPEPLRLQDLTSFLGGGTVTNIPAGGNTGDALVKNSGTNYDVKWTSDSNTVAAGTNIAVTGTSPATVSTIPNPTFTTVNGNTLTTGTGTLTFAGIGKSLTVNNSLALTGTDATTLTFQGSDTYVGRATTDTLTNKSYDTNNTGNVFGINGVLVNANTGTGAVVRSSLPTLSSPSMSTPTITGHPSIEGVTSTGATGTGNFVFSTSPTLVTPALGTPTSVTLTSATGLPISTGVSGLAAGIATYLGAPSSANLRASMTDETGTGLVVFSTTPTLVTPVLGAATATTINGATVSPGHHSGEPSSGNALAGEIGEFVTAVTTTTGITTGTQTNITSISLTAGDWDVYGEISYSPAATTSFTDMYASISLTSATLDQTTFNYARYSVASAGVVTAGLNNVVRAGPRRVSIASTTTVFLVGFTDFTVSTMSTIGGLRARRVR